ncbi:MAG: ParM/StbA family protein [Clostridia bacterium]|nr:ParM/StbA family protein [Clostridia bacterium]
MIIGIDHGFGMIKTRSVSFRAGVDIMDRPPAIPTPDCIEWNGSYCTLSGARNVLLKDKTGSDEYFIQTLFAIAKELRSRGDYRTELPVTIAAGLPIGDFQRQRDAFDKYLRRPDSDYTFTLGNDNFKIHVEDIHLFPQGYAAVVQQLAHLRSEPVVHIIDIGSWTMDTLTLHGGSPDLSSIDSHEVGVIACLNYVAKAIKEETGRSYTNEQVEAVLWCNNVTIEDEIKELMRDYCRRWCEMVVRRIVENGFEISTAVTRFVGGGSYLIKNFYRDAHRDEMRDVEFTEDICANAVGYELLASGGVG